jgi:methyl-accepting chemotaxis protein
MKWFTNLAIRTKLFLGFGLMVVLLVMVTAVAYRGIDMIRENQKQLFEEDFARVIDIMEVQFNQTKIRLNATTELLVTQRSAQESSMNDSKDRMEKIGGVMQDLLEREKNNAERLVKIRELDTLRKAYAETRNQQVVPLILAGKIEEAKALVLGIQAECNQKINVIADELVGSEKSDAQSAFTNSVQVANQSILIFVLVGIAAIVLGIAIALILNRLISSPLKEISRAAQRIAAGDLTGDISKDDRKDEVGVLAGTFRSMVANLRDLNREIGEGVNVLASSANEILATATQVGTGAAETAAAVSQTTATVEEVRQTAQLSGQKAKHVSDSAQKAVQISQAGKKAVGDAIEGMGRIKDQVESIAENIVRLSEQSQAIAEIAGTVADLAGQVNLLSVNASIEASKAGEQGKGFLVVAQEVKNLSVQSKQASSQVRSILNDVQKAISAAVMATEQGSRMVESGSEQTSRAGESIQILTDTIAESAQAAIQVAASSQQQQAGMDQLASAMESIKQASAQNAASTKQAEGAARGLHDLGQNLKRLVERYNVQA